MHDNPLGGLTGTLSGCHLPDIHDGWRSGRRMAVGLHPQLPAGWL